MRFANPAFGQSVQGLGNALFGNPQAEGQAMLAKSQMDRQNQETLAREQLGNILSGALESGLDPRQAMADIYGHSVRIGDGMAGLAPDFALGAGMGIYGTEGLGQRGAADLALGAQVPFQNTEMGVNRALGAQAAQAAAAQRAAMEMAQFEASQNIMASEGDIMLSPEGQVLFHGMGSEVLGPDERQTGFGPDGQFGVQADAVPGFNEADMAATRAGAAVDMADADRTRLGNALFRDNPELLANALSGSDGPPPGMGVGDGRNLFDREATVTTLMPQVQAMAEQAQREGSIPAGSVSQELLSRVQLRAREILSDPNGPSDMTHAVAAAMDEIISGGVFADRVRTGWRPTALGGGEDYLRPNAGGGVGQADLDALLSMDTDSMSPDQLRQWNDQMEALLNGR